MEFNAPVPVLRIFDEAIAQDFYINFLEFKIDWQHRFEADLPLYQQISKGNCVLHLTEHFGDGSPGSSIRIQMKDLKTYQQLLLAKRYKNARPGILSQPWGSEEMTLTDPFYNKLVFYQNS